VALLGGTQLPRRAALVDGRIVDRVDALLRAAAAAAVLPPESEVLSQACERLRQSQGKPSWPRDTRALALLCLGRDRGLHPGAWQAMYHDLLTEDADAAAFAEEASRDPSAVADVLAGATDADTLSHAGGCLSRLLPELEPGALCALGWALGSRLPDIVGKLREHAPRVARDQLDVLVVALGATLSRVPLDPDHLAAALDSALEDRQAWALTRLFLRLDLPPASLRASDLLDKLAARAAAARPDQRYALLALAHKAVSFRRGEPREPSYEALLELAATTAAVPGLDARVLLACGALGESLGEGREAAFAGAAARLAHALLQAAARPQDP
jgi:hypothetical protein